MTVLISERIDGKGRRCDAKCYNATGEKCTCICGRVNHGVGYQQACDNTQAMIEDEVLDDVIYASYQSHMLNELFP